MGGTAPTLPFREENERVEFKVDSEESYKKLPKEVSALANSEGGFILIGVRDDGTVEGLKRPYERALKKASDALQQLSPYPKVSFHRLEVDGKEVLMIEVEKSPSLVVVGQRAYVRVGANSLPLSLEQAALRLINERKTTLDTAPSPAGKEDIEWEEVERYLKLRREKGLPVGGEHALEELGIMVGERPTNAALLVFGKAPQRYFPMAIVRVVRWWGQDRMEPVAELRGNLLRQVEEGIKLLDSLNPMVEWRTAGRRRILKAYPSIAVREVFINAVVHRNYGAPAPIYVAFYPERLVISNPGAIPPKVLKKPTHLPTNPTIATIFWVYGYIEAFGTGLRRIHEEVEAHPFVSFRFTSTEDPVEAVFERKPPMEEKLLQLLREPLSSSEVAEALGVSKPTAIKLLKELEKAGLIKSMGRGRGKRYVRV